MTASKRGLTTRRKRDSILQRGIGGTEPAMDYCLRIADNALENMTLAALEAYCLGAGGKKKQIETLGYMWGVTNTARGTTNIFVERMSVSVSARRHPDWVEPNDDAPRLKNEIIRRWSPHLKMLGDFHTHPYESLSEVADEKGYEFSDDDFECFIDDDFMWEESGNTPLMLVATITRLGKVRDSHGPTHLRSNIVAFDIGEFRIWLNASVGYLDEDGKRRCTRNKGSPVRIDLGPRLFNFSGDRVFGSGNGSGNG